MEIDCSFERIKTHLSPSHDYMKYRIDWETVPKAHITTRFPIHLDIEITNRCNMKCKMCAFHAPNARFPMKDEDMPFFLYQKIIDEGCKKGLKSIKLNYAGEPLLHPQIFEMIKYAKQQGILDVMFNTNGTLLDNPTIVKLIIAGLDKIIISDYGDERVMQHIINLYSIKAIHNQRKPLLRVQRLVYPGEDRNDVKAYLLKEFNEYADELGVQFYFNYNKKKKNRHRSHFECAFPFQRMLIMANGEVHSCCGMPYPTKRIGDAYTDSLEELWHSDYMEFVRKRMKSHESHLISACAVCPMRIKVLEVNYD